MAWIEFHATRIVKLKKFQDFRSTLQISKHEALGLLGSFWCEVLELRETGDVTDWTPEYLGELLGLKLSPERVWKALEAGWLDDVNGRKIVHDWWDTAGKYLTSKYRNTEPEKLHTIKESLTITSLKSSAPLVRPIYAPPNLTIPNQPNQTKPKGCSFRPPTVDDVKEYCQERKNGIDAQYFIDRNTGIGWVDKNGNKYKDWKAVIRTWEKYNINKSTDFSTLEGVKNQREQADKIVEQFRQEQRRTGTPKTV